MMRLVDRIDAFASLGELLFKLRSPDDPDVAGKDQDSKSPLKNLNSLIEDASNYNGWFTTDMVRHMILAIVESLRRDKLEAWLKPYSGKLEDHPKQKTVAIIMAGNIPAVAFHDLLSVLITGQKCKAKLSSDDNKLLPAIVDILVSIEPRFQDKVEFIEGKLVDFDAVIATGSNNTSQYFDYYFGKYPNIIRRNRNGVAVLTGYETEQELQGLADDIFLYYGLGCRNVSKVFIPKAYGVEKLLDVLAGRKKIAENHKYFNNYEYNKAIYLINTTPHYDSGNLLLVENKTYASPVSVVFYEFYEDMISLNEKLADDNDQVQCVVAGNKEVLNAIPFGTSQQPDLWDYADGVDTIEFLLSLKT